MLARDMAEDKPQEAAAWEVQLLRLTAFPVAADPIQPQPWWPEVVGQPPEQETSRPQAQQWAVEGPPNFADMSEARLELQAQSTRIDWLLRAQNRDDALAVLAPLPTVLSTFRSVMSRWLSTLDLELKRLALGAVVIIPVANHEQGYRRLAKYLPFPLDPDASDFLYRINRPTPSSSLADGTLINRLQKWGVVQFEIVQVRIASEGTAEMSDRSTPSFACRLELDLSTAAERTAVLPKKKLGEVLSELSEVALHVAEHGDRQ